MLKEGDALHFVSEAFKHCKPMATSGDGIRMLEKAFVMGVNFAENASNEVVSHKGIVTAGTDADADEFAEKLIESVKKHRHWERLEKEMVPA